MQFIQGWVINSQHFLQQALTGVPLSLWVQWQVSRMSCSYDRLNKKPFCLASSNNKELILNRLKHLTCLLLSFLIFIFFSYLSVHLCFLFKKQPEYLAIKNRMSSRFFTCFYSRVNQHQRRLFLGLLLLFF